MKQLKLITISINLLVFTNNIKSQNNMLKPFLSNWEEIKCGTWVLIKSYDTKWYALDTINYCATCDSTWVYTDWKVTISNYTYAIYSPCGNRGTTDKERTRINRRGVRQTQLHIYEYEYHEKPKSEYEQVSDEISKRHNK
jgi:hypothetical protein